METVQLPEGWQWDALLLESSGMPGWALLTQDPTSGSAYALIYCSGDAAQLFARRDAVDRAVGVPSRHAIPIGSGDPEVDGRIATEVVLIGDESRATHDAVGDFTTLQWRNGDIVGEIRASGGLDFADVEEFALALDTLLPGDWEGASSRAATPPGRPALDPLSGTRRMERTQQGELGCSACSSPP